MSYKYAKKVPGSLISTDNSKKDYPLRNCSLTSYPCMQLHTVIYDIYTSFSNAKVIHTAEFSQHCSFQHVSVFMFGKEFIVCIVHATVNICISCILIHTEVMHINICILYVHIHIFISTYKTAEKFAGKHPYLIGFFP
jgi:hypothetical protein